jgi:hypothetical protein
LIWPFLFPVKQKNRQKTGFTLERANKQQDLLLHCLSIVWPHQALVYCALLLLLIRLLSDPSFVILNMAYSYLAVHEATHANSPAVDVKREMYCRQKGRLRRMILTGKDEIAARPASFQKTYDMKSAFSRRKQLSRL